MKKQSLVIPSKYIYVTKLWNHEGFQWHSQEILYHLLVFFCQFWNRGVKCTVFVPPRHVQPPSYSPLLVSCSICLQTQCNMANITNPSVMNVSWSYFALIFCASIVLHPNYSQIKKFFQQWSEASALWALLVLLALYYILLITGLVRLCCERSLWLTRSAIFTVSVY